MSEQTNQEVNQTSNQETQTENTEVKQETKSFTQDQLNSIIESRIMAERKKYEKKLAEQQALEQKALEEKQISEVKTKQELEKIMQEKLAQKDAEINKIRSEIQRERIDKNILAVASTQKAIVPEQIVSLLKPELQLSDDGRVEVLDKNGNIRYNEKGQALTIEERVKEFLDTNPHFRQGSLSGAGSQSSIGGRSQKPINIGDLDLNNPADRKVYAEMRQSKAGFKLNPKLTINN